MTPDPGEPRYVVTLRVVADPVWPARPRPVPIRLRAALKVLLRSFGLRAVSVEEVDARAAKRTA